MFNILLISDNTMEIIISNGSFLNDGRLFECIKTIERKIEQTKKKKKGNQYIMNNLLPLCK